MLSEYCSFLLTDLKSSLFSLLPVTIQGLYGLLLAC